MELDIVRALAPEARATDTGADRVMRGHFSVFNDWYEIDSWYEGRFLERVAPGSFKKTFKERGAAGQIKVLFDHGFDPQIGNKVLGMPETLTEDERGAYYEVPLFDTSYNADLEPGLRAGAYGASFRFRVMKDAWDNEPKRSDYNPDGIPERTIKEVRVYEFGPVTFPANESASAGMRSLTDSFYAKMERQAPETVAELRSRIAQLRTPTREPQIDTDEPDLLHSEGLNHSARAAWLRAYDLRRIGA